MHFGELSKVLRSVQTTQQIRFNMPVQTADLLTRYDNRLHVSTGLPPMQPREGLKEDFEFVYLFQLFKSLNFDNQFYPAVFKAFFECFNFSSCNFEINTDKSSVKC